MGPDQVHLLGGVTEALIPGKICLSEINQKRMKGKNMEICLFKTIDDCKENYFTHYWLKTKIFKNTTGVWNIMKPGINKTFNCCGIRKKRKETPT